jgi:hypothetical protein
VTPSRGCLDRIPGLGGETFLNLHGSGVCYLRTYLRARLTVIEPYELYLRDFQRLYFRPIASPWTSGP